MNEKAKTLATVTIGGIKVELFEGSDSQGTYYALHKTNIFTEVTPHAVYTTADKEKAWKRYNEAVEELND